MRAPRTPRAGAAVLGTALFGVLLACGNGAVDPGGGRAPATALGFATAAVGRAERGDSVRVVAVRGPDTLAVDSVAVSPAASADVAPGGWLRLRAAGPLTVTATARDGATSAGSTPPAAAIALASAVLAVADPPTLVFDLLRDGNRDVWRVALDGASLTRLTSDPGDDEHPTAAGGTVVFTSYRTGRAQLFAVAPDGTGERRLTATADNLVEPALAPDGRHLAYVRDTTGARRLWWSAADGGAPAPAAAAAWAGAVDGAPAWAPAGAPGDGRVAYMSTRAGAPGVFLLAPAAPNTTPDVALGATPDPASASVEPAWSPDGRRLVVTSTRAGAGDLFVVDLATGAATQLTHSGGTVGQAAWLADGRIVFTAFARAGSRLRWLDPRAPDVLHDVPTGPGSAAHAAPLR